uniref:Uncharacterized protein n=1 Tax=Timema douglasi TaxID=61478 RepID=A0A7R8W157_TIMDO|nr:unnamed protein product [Timema douglasi]
METSVSIVPLCMDQDERGDPHWYRWEKEMKAVTCDEGRYISPDEEGLKSSLKSQLQVSHLPRNMDHLVSRDSCQVQIGLETDYRSMGVWFPTAAGLSGIVGYCRALSGITRVLSGIVGYCRALSGITRVLTIVLSGITRVLTIVLSLILMSLTLAASSPSWRRAVNHVSDQRPSGSSLDHSSGEAALHDHEDLTDPQPEVKYVHIPVPQPFPVAVPQPVLVAVPQPYPVHIRVPERIEVPVVKTVQVPVEHPAPYHVEKKVPFPVVRHVPVYVYKQVSLPVEQPYPVQVPVVKYIHHHQKSGGGGGGKHS